MLADGQALRQAMRCYVTGVTVVTSVGPNGKLNGLTVNSFNSVALDPPLVLFSLGRQAQSFEEVRDAEGFVVNVLSQDQQALSDRFAQPAEDKLAGLEWRPSSTGAPILPNVVAWMDCVTEHRYRGGDHVIMVGRVVGVGSDEALEPLVYHHSEYRRLAPR